MNNPCRWLLAGLACAAGLSGGFILPLCGQENPSTPVRSTISFGPQERQPWNTRDFRISPEIVGDAQTGAFRLAHSVLVADEMGATDFRQSEELTATTWARKQFVLDSGDVTGSELLLFGSATKVHVNGTAVEGLEPLVSTGWSRLKVPPGLWKTGTNEVVLSGGGSLLVEPGRQSGRSFKSSDGGKSWTAQALGAAGNVQGEYLVRLRLGRHAPRGWVMSPVFDLWNTRPGEVPRPGKVVSFGPLTGLPAGQPSGTLLTPRVRTGTTPTPDAKTWTDWLPLEQARPAADLAPGQRWAQLRFDLVSERPQATPHLPAAFAWTMDFVPDRSMARGTLAVGEPAPRYIALGSVPFVYQEPSPRLKLLRERYQLDQVIAPGRTEMEQLMLLRHWIRNQWHTAWGSNEAAWMPPWDALMILESKDQPDCLTMCTHYAAVFTQCCLALGWNARHCILDHHCVSEVWVNQHARWVMMDTGNSAERADLTLHFERNGIPLSARELQRVQRTGQTGDLTVCFTPARLMAAIAGRCRPAPPPVKPWPPRPDTAPAADFARYPVCGLDNYRRYAFPARNNFLSSLLPGELYQGWSHYFYDGYCWVGDAPEQPVLAPEYSRHLPPGRPQDIDWSLNWVRVHLARTSMPGDVRVDLETLTPNLARLESTLDGHSWKPTAPGFSWKLKPGLNELRVRSVNHWDRTGPETRAQVTWTPGDRPQ